ncbi:MAG: UTP--glucose-1-phosphate uridylyltransferase GalU [Chloroflexota bacterium]|nr:UTP--glucose-1-phosphate uridylyltransferase GalU [Chloroflexota bacterium]
MHVRKAVILAAGYGTRFLPATKAVPKEMLPLVDRPAIQYVVEEALRAGLEQIIMVTAASKRAVEDHFDRDLELERWLEQKGRRQQAEDVRRVAEVADIAYVRQKERLGIGHAVLMARSLVGDEPFALFFPDDIIESDVPAIGQLMDVHDRYGGSVVAVERLPREELPHYGVIEPKELEERVYQVLSIVEKPTAAEAKSDLGTVGRLVLTPAIFPVIERTPPGAGGEIQLTDSLGLLLEVEPLYACRFVGERFDVGRPLGFLKASLSMALRRPDLGPELRRYLQEVLARLEVGG